MNEKKSILGIERDGLSAVKEQTEKRESKQETIPVPGAVKEQTEKRESKQETIPVPGSEKDVGLKGLTPIQQAGMLLAIFVGSMISVVLLSTLVYWFVTSPKVPFSIGSDNASALDTFKVLNEISLERFIKLFDLVVSKTLLPVFATIIGYVLGTQSQKKDV